MRVGSTDKSTRRTVSEPTRYRVRGRRDVRASSTASTTLWVSGLALFWSCTAPLIPGRGTKRMTEGRSEVAVLRWIWGCGGVGWGGGGIEGRAPFHFRFTFALSKTYLKNSENGVSDIPDFNFFPRDPLDSRLWRSPNSEPPVTKSWIHPAAAYNK